jgi:hypothetical protein
MNQLFTVYFDTSFYVKLCSADEAIASQTINDLNQLQVRHVLSDVIILELLSSSDRTDRDVLLMERVNGFQVSPYLTGNEIAWEVLLLAGAERMAMADLLKSIDDFAAAAKSSSIMARRKVSPDREANLLNAAKPILKQFGFPEDIGRDIPQTITATKAMLESLGMTDIVWPDNLTQENLLALSEQIKERLGTSTLEQLEEQDRLYDSVTATDDRPYQVLVGEASSKTRKNLANTLRDSEHMMRFISHVNQIDLFQVDCPQENIIKRNKPVHRLAEMGLAGRCFSADSLSETVETVRELKNRYF